MKNIVVITLFISLACVSCKDNGNKNKDHYEDDVEVKNPEPIVVDTKEKMVTTAEAIAQANGIKHWDNVKEIKFTFNVDRDTTHFERSWSWKPKENLVTLATKEDTIAYNRKKIDNTSLKTDQKFINDKFWLLTPFNLVWDANNFTSEYFIKAIAPISNRQMQKLTITYGDTGGYTPKDAYDFYFEGDFIIKEWVFRQGNVKEPSLSTTWENYETFNGIKIAKTHKKNEDNWTLYFTDIEVITQ